MRTTSFKFAPIWPAMISVILCILAVSALEPPCNPLVDQGCVAHNSALGSEVFLPFSAESPDFQATMADPNIVFDSDGAHLLVNERGDNPQVFSSKYIMYGRAEADVIAAKGTSVILSLYLQSDDLDEIDIGEFFGGNGHVFQTNYFVKGNVSNYERDEYHKSGLSCTEHYHRFGVEWTPNAITWTVNGNVLRLVEAGSPHGFPSLPMRLIFSLWVGGDEENEEGTIEWSGGAADYTELPYTMHVRNVRLEDYSLGQEYVYGNGHGLEASNGHIYGPALETREAKHNSSNDTVSFDQGVLEASAAVKAGLSAVVCAVLTLWWAA